MPRLVSIEGETNPTLETPNGQQKRALAEPKKKGNTLGGMMFRDADAVTPVDEQAAFLAKLLQRYPDAATAKIDESLKALIVPIEGLEPDPDNAVSHPEPNMRAIMESFAAFGQRKPIVVRAENMRVMAGNGSLEAVKRLGWDVVAAAVQSMSDAEAAAYGLSDNRTSDLHKWDKEKVKLLDALIREANDPKVRTVGWSSAELQSIRKFIPPTTAPQLTGMIYKIVIECKDEAHQVELLGEFEQRSIKCQALIS